MKLPFQGIFSTLFGVRIWCIYMSRVFTVCCVLCFIVFFIFFSCLAYLTASKVWLCCYVDDASMNAVLFQYKMDLFYQALVSLLSDFCYILPLPL